MAAIRLTHPGSVVISERLTVDTSDGAVRNAGRNRFDPGSLRPADDFSSPASSRHVDIADGQAHQVALCASAPPTRTRHHRYLIKDGRSAGAETRFRRCTEVM
jgi:hypothetical protein